MAAVAADDLAAHREAVRGLLTRWLQNEALAEDLVQEALIRASASACRGESSPRTWLSAIALNLARDHFRQAARRPTEELEAAAEMRAEGDPEHDALQAEMSACILAFIDRLNPRQREAVLMHHMAGLTHKEIAAALEVSEGNARVLLHRGLAALKVLLDQGCVIDLGDHIPCERK